MAGPISDKVGRRDALLYSCVFWLLGTALQVACNGKGMLIAGRVFNGVTVGITSSQVPVYLAEISKHSQRGAIIIIQQLAIEWGILIMSVIPKHQIHGCSVDVEIGTLLVMDAPISATITPPRRSAQPGAFNSFHAYFS